MKYRNANCFFLLVGKNFISPTSSKVEKTLKNFVDLVSGKEKKKTRQIPAIVWFIFERVNVNEHSFSLEIRPFAV